FTVSGSGAISAERPFGITGLLVNFWVRLEGVFRRSNQTRLRIVEYGQVNGVATAAHLRTHQRRAVMNRLDVERVLHQLRFGVFEWPVKFVRRSHKKIAGES